MNDLHSDAVPDQVVVLTAIQSIANAVTGVENIFNKLSANAQEMSKDDTTELKMFTRQVQGEIAKLAPALKRVRKDLFSLKKKEDEELTEPEETIEELVQLASKL